MRTIIDFLRHEYPGAFTPNDIAYEMDYTTDEVLHMLAFYIEDGDIQTTAIHSVWEGADVLLQGVMATRPMSDDEADVYEEDLTIWIDDDCD